MTLEVTQEDRARAVEIMRDRWNKPIRERVLAGGADHYLPVQECAAHRWAAEWKVVEWLCRQHEAVQAFQEYAPRNLSEVADAIERGEHRK